MVYNPLLFPVRYALPVRFMKDILITDTPSVSHRADKNENTLGQQKEKCSPDISKDVGTSYKIFCTENFDKTTFFYKGNDGGW